MPRDCKYSNEFLKEDIQRVAEKLEKSPTENEYERHGKASSSTVANRFGCWTDGIRAAGLKPDREISPSANAIIRDIQKVVSEVGRSPTSSEYAGQGDYTQSELVKTFGGFNEAIRAAGYLPKQEGTVPPKRVLFDIREVANQAEHSNSLREEYAQSEDSIYSTSTVEKKFEGWWRGVVRAGIRPYHAAPLSPFNYKMFIYTGVKSKTVEGIYAQLAAFTGIPTSLLAKFSLDWVSRLNSDRRETLITIPSSELVIDKKWVITIPETWTDPITGATKSTTINELLKFIELNGESILYKNETDIREIIRQTARSCEIERRVKRQEVRAGIATHLARRGVPVWKIKHQVGGEKTGWQRTVEDYCFYLYQFEDISHSDYTPDGIFLDPNTGIVEKVDSDK